MDLEAGSHVCIKSVTCATTPVNQVASVRVIQAMSEFATLASPYSMPAALHGDVDLTDPEEQTQTRALNQFLAGVELKAFKIAQAALRHEDDALDAVQDAMLQLARAYSKRPPEEWKPLFYRILENRIRDMQRRRTVRGRIMAWLPLRGEDDDDEFDPVAQAPSLEPQPVRRLEHSPAHQRNTQRRECPRSHYGKRGAGCAVLLVLWDVIDKMGT